MKEENDIVVKVIFFFTNLLVKSPNLVEHDQLEILSNILALIQPEENAMIGVIPSPQEVEQVVSSLAPDKSLGLDGFPYFFFQMFQNVVQDDVTKVVQEVFSRRSMPLPSAYPKGGRGRFYGPIQTYQPV